MDKLDGILTYKAYQARETANIYNYKDKEDVKELKKITEKIEKIAKQGGYSIRWIPKHTDLIIFMKIFTRLGYSVHMIDNPRGCVEISWR